MNQKQYNITLTKKELDGEIKWYVMCQADDYVFETSGIYLNYLFEELIRNIKNSGYWEILEIEQSKLQEGHQDQDIWSTQTSFE